MNWLSKVVIFLADESKTQSKMKKQPCRFGDIYQTATRIPTSTEDVTCLIRKKKEDNRRISFEISYLNLKLCIASLHWKTWSMYDYYFLTSFYLPPAAEEVPTILPSSKVWDIVNRRLLLGLWDILGELMFVVAQVVAVVAVSFFLISGRELLHMQGIQYPKEKLRGFSENQLGDFAGNAFLVESRLWCAVFFITVYLPYLVKSL